MARKGKLRLLLLAALVAAACGTPPPAPEQGAALRPPSARPTGRIAFRPRLTFSDGRSSLAGVTFLVAGRSALAIASSHVVLAALKKSTLTRFELVDAASKQTEATARGLAVAAGPPMDGFDFSTDFSILMLDQVPAGAARLELAPERVKLGEEVEVVACPTDGSVPEIVMDGRVTVSTSTRIEVHFTPIGQARGFAGAPIISRETGLLVAVLQTAAVSGSVALGRATPAEAIAKKLGQADAATVPLPLENWK